MQPSNRRVALVTGANRGIGFAIAEQLAHIVLWILTSAREEEKGRQADRMLAKHGDVQDILFDVNDAASIQAALGRIGDAFGRLDILVNNAGIQIDGETTLLELPLTTLQKTLETNAVGSLLVTRACLPLMKANHPPICALRRM